MVSPSCATGGPHATKIESYLRIKLDDTANTWEIWNREGTKITLAPVMGQLGATPVSATIFESHFDGSAEGFTYADDIFGSASYSWYYADGAWDSGALNVTLGGLNSYIRTDMSGGWTNSFTLPTESDVTLSFTYKLDLAAGYEADEYSQLLLSFNGAAPVTVAEFTGGTGHLQTTGLQTYTANLGSLAAGTYSFSIGGYNNKKTYADEVTTILIDDVVVTGSQDTPAYDFATTYRWAVSEVVDTHANTVSYSWFNDGGEAYPATVSYNGSEIDFYWEGRPDTYSRAIGPGGMVDSNLRLKTIGVETGGQRVRAYALTYDAPLTTTEEGLLASVQMYGKDAVLDANGNITAGTSLPPTSFTYYDDPTVFAAGTSWSTAHSGNAYKAESVQYADVNGDNLADRIFRTTSNQVHVSLSDGTAFAAPTLWANPGGTYKTDQDSYADVDGDGMADMVFRKSNNQVGVYLSDGTGFQAPASWNAMGGSYYAGQVNVGDVNGDGKADLVFVGVTKSNTDQTLQNTGGCQAPYDPTEFPFCPSGYFPVDTWTENGSCQQGELRPKYYTKCRRTLYTEKLYLGLSSGTAFDTPTLQYNLTGASASNSYHSDRVKLADVNGDGLVDFSYRTDGNNVKIGLSDGDSVLPLVSWYDFSGSYQAGQLQYADVNGDGTADAIFHPISSGCSQYTRTANRTGYPACNSGDTVVGFDSWTEEAGHSGGSYTVYETTCKHCNVSGSQLIQVSLSTGSDFVAPETWFTGVPANAEPDLVKFADFEGDGRAGLSYRNGSNAVTIALSMGTQFTTLTTLPAFNGSYKVDQIQLADVNGDGKDDVIHRATTQVTSVALAGPAATPTHALKSVTNVYGGTLTYAYTPSSAWENTNLPFVVNTLTSVTADDGRGGVSTSTYAYAGGLWDAPERRFLGFRTATATLPCLDGEIACPTVTTTFIQDFGAYSKPEKIERRDGAGTLLTMLEQEYSLNGATIPYSSLNTGTTRTIYEGGQSRRTKTTRTFDAYANIIDSTFHGDFDQLGDELKSTVEYFPNTTDYIVGLPARLRKYEGVGSTGVMYSESLLYYDGAADVTLPPSEGDITTAKDWNSNTEGYVAASLEYDTFGNVTATVDPLGRRSEVEYDSIYNRFVVVARNPLYFDGDTRQITSAIWDSLCQLPSTEIDVNSQTTTHQYDALCRGIRTDTPAGNFSLTSYSNLGDPLLQFVQREAPPTDGSGNIWTRRYLDGWGRVVRSASKGPNVAQDIIVDRVYDARGNLANVTRPYYLGDVVYSTTFEYDGRNREVELGHPDATAFATAYTIGSSFTSVITTDEVNHVTARDRDAYGRVVRKEEVLGGSTVSETYNWDLLGRLIGVSDDAGNIWLFAYDSLGRRLTVDDPDLGGWNYTYDAAGQLTEQTDAKGQTTSFIYDHRGRVIEKHVYNLSTAQTDVTTYGYDEDRANYYNVGHMTSAENAVGRIEYDHDKDGRLARTAFTIDGRTFLFETGFDVAGRPLWQSYPDGDFVGSPADPIRYDSAGRTIDIPGVISAVAYDARGRATTAIRDSGVITTFGYSSTRGWLESMLTLSGATTVQDYMYQRRVDGEIVGISSSLLGENWTYTYDDLKRLTSATNADNSEYSRAYSYDSVGNITYKSDVGSYYYPAPGSPHPHAVTTAGAQGYAYDANGNMIQVMEDGDVLRQLTWDGEDRPTEIDGVNFFYGPDGGRWKKVEVATGQVTLTLGEVEVQQAGTVNEALVKYLPGGARRTGSTTIWHHKDHLGSIQAVTDVTGSVSLRRIHLPYGERVYDSGSSFVEAMDFVGERLDEETGLVYLNARYYDPVLARFISGDPSSPVIEGVGVNRYAYGLNNPVFYSDPYGLLSAGEREIKEADGRRAAREAAEAVAAQNGE